MQLRISADTVQEGNQCVRFDVEGSDFVGDKIGDSWTGHRCHQQPN